MKCPFCNHLESKVVDSRLGKDKETIRRRRECLKCQKRFTTTERAEDSLRSDYTFGVLIDAQALGDLRALGEAGRRIIRIHFDRRPAEGLDLLNDWLG